MQVKIPFVFMRGGTSRAAFFMEKDLPSDQETRDRVILAAFGSPDPNGRQIDGIGGATLPTSKVAIISKSNVPGTSINYKYAQVSITTPSLSYVGNCGNISSAVGPFAIDEGLVPPKEPVTTVTIWQENTKKTIIAEVPVKDGKHLVEGDYSIHGIPGTGSKVTLRFLEPAGSVTNKLLPTGHVKDTIKIREYGSFTVSIVDAGNPSIFFKAKELGLQGTETDLNSKPDIARMLVDIRRHVAVMIGIAKSVEDAPPNLPLAVLVSEAKGYKALTNQTVNSEDIDLVARSLSLDKIHGSYPVTGAICTAGAAKIDGTVVNELMSEKSLSRDEVRIGHPAGVIAAKPVMEKEKNDFHYVEASIGRTARRLAEGFVLVPEKCFLK